MSATVISLASRRGDHGPPDCCPLHMVEALLVRVQTTAREHEDELLVPGEVLAALAADVLGTVTASLNPSDYPRRTTR